MGKKKLMNTEKNGIIRISITKNEIKMGAMYNPSQVVEFNIGENKYRFIDYWENPNNINSSYIRAWEMCSKGIQHFLNPVLIPLSIMGKDDLMLLELWDKISQIEKEKVLDFESKIQSEIDKIPVKKIRKNYDNIPDQMLCSKCKQYVDVVRSNIAKKIQDTTIEEYKKIFECSICNPPFRGRKANPEYANVPKEMTCITCGKKQTVIPSYLVNKAKNKNTTVEKLVETYQCQKCNPTKGHKSKGEKSDFPTETICKGCKKSIKIVKSNIERKAKILKISVKELIDNYKCRSCGGRLNSKKKPTKKKVVTS